MLTSHFKAILLLCMLTTFHLTVVYAQDAQAISDAEAAKKAEEEKLAQMTPEERAKYEEQQKTLSQMSPEELAKYEEQQKQLAAEQAAQQQAEQEKMLAQMSAEERAKWEEQQKLNSQLSDEEKAKLEQATVETSGGLGESSQVYSHVFEGFVHTMALIRGPFSHQYTHTSGHSNANVRVNHAPLVAEGSLMATHAVQAWCAARAHAQAVRLERVVSTIITHVPSWCINQPISPTQRAAVVTLISLAWMARPMISRAFLACTSTWCQSPSRR